MTDVAVLIPWGSTCPHRTAALRWTVDRLADIHPSDIVLGNGATPDGFSRTRGILHAFDNTDADVLVIADGDVWCDGLPDAIDHARTAGWAIPHRMIHRLSADSTAKVLAGADWHGLPLSTDNRQDSRPYLGHEAGTLLVVTRDALTAAPPDPRFVGWGQEDDAWAAALHTLVGKPWRGTADLVHLWHPAEPRQNRRVGSPEGLALARRYHDARRRPEHMRALLAEIPALEEVA